MPVVSVILAVYNGERFLREAVESILSQTFRDFEFLILDDGSTDGTKAILDEFANSDPRIRLYDNSNKIGLSRTLNRGLESAQGKYVARMDADDVSLPKRLECQVEFMESQPDIGVCGSWIEVLGAVLRAIWYYPQSHEEIHVDLLFHNSLAHPSIMMRRSIVLANNLFYSSDPIFNFAEDYELWTRFIRCTRLANIPEVLLSYRVHQASISYVNATVQRDSARLLSHQQLSTLLGEISPDELAIHDAILNGRSGKNTEFIEKAGNWLLKIREANHRQKIYSDRFLNHKLEGYWSQICDHAFSQGQQPIFDLLSSPLRYHGTTGLSKVYRVFRKSISSLYHS